MTEAAFQRKLISDLERLLPGCVVLKNDPTYIQGVPDLTVFYNNRWAALECKVSATASHQRNQDYYVDMLDRMSFARFIYPENKEAVLNELLESFGA